MIVRIVKLHFEPTKVSVFIDFFDQIKHIVNGFDGCYGMQLLQDKNNPGIVMTYSHWENENALENYRKSDAFGEIWPTIKPWFIEKPEAWTLNPYFNGFEEKKNQ